MKDGVIIINTARGIIIDEEALLEALESRKVYMAGLDVVANEPPQYQIPLMQSPYIFITSHIAWQPKRSKTPRSRSGGEKLPVLPGGNADECD